ncbi:fibrinogen- and Ig-binding protein-like [Watersipora subatra]|uniref:fibrinogen- and Ig-binding protein-like n=1 Tax=Watersipora subatra TaxID=2589382 RepID=UPI00355B56CB
MGDKGATITSSLKVQQDERLNKKHIQTLGYVQELMNENKKLRQLLEEYEQQKLHCDELHALNDALNSSLEEALRAKSELAVNHLEMRGKTAEYEHQIDNLQQQVRSLREENGNQLKEIRRLDLELCKQQALKEQLGSANQTIKQLEGIRKQLESELTASNASLLALQDNEIKSYKSKLMKALNEVSSLQHLLHGKDSEISMCKRSAEELMGELEATQIKRYSFEREVEALKREVTELKETLSKLKGKSDDSATFKEFVSIKRELSTLQEENNFLKERLLSATKTSPSVGKQNSKQKITLLLR